MKVWKRSRWFEIVSSFPATFLQIDLKDNNAMAQLPFGYPPWCLLRAGHDWLNLFLSVQSYGSLWCLYMEDGQINESEKTRSVHLSLESKDKDLSSNQCRWKHFREDAVRGGGLIEVLKCFQCAGACTPIDVFNEMTCVLKQRWDAV